MQAISTAVAPQIEPALIDQLAHGIALADAESWLINFTNTRFAQWFPAGDTMDERLPGLDVPRARTRIAAGRPHTFDVELRQGARTTVVQVEIKPVEIAGRRQILVECHDASARRQAELMLDSYSKLAERHARELTRTKERAEKLLLNVMPRSVYEELKECGSAVPQRIEAATVLMLDVVGFTEMALAQDPQGLIAELNDVFTAFDRVVELFGCERIKTIGDGYVAVAGLGGPASDDAVNLARAALRMKRYLERRNAQHEKRWTCRFGLATGPLIGALVGVQKYIFDVFGPAVNLAARLECKAEPMQILVCADTKAKLAEEFLLSPLGPLAIKGFGEREVFALEDEVRGKT
jgi:adenylate cyclase